MSIVRVGVVGTGSMGRAHVAAITDLDGATVTAVCDPDQGRREQVAREYGVGLATADLDELLAGPVDAVVVATPESAHLEPVLACLSAGKHVLVEKPLTTDVAEAHELAAAAAAAGVVVVPGFNLRYDDRHRAVRAWLNSEHAGEVVSLYLRRNRPASMFATYQRIHPAFESSSHDVDVLLWFTGRRARRVYAVDRGRPGERNPFGVWSIIEMDGGVVATVEGVWSIPDAAGVARGDVVEVIATQGTAHIDVDAQTTSFWDGRGVTATHRRIPWGARPYNASVAAEVADFVACARTGEPSSVASLSDAVHTVEVVCAMIESARTGAPVELAGG